MKKIGKHVDKVQDETNICKIYKTVTVINQHPYFTTVTVPISFRKVPFILYPVHPPEKNCKKIPDFLPELGVFYSIWSIYIHNSTVSARKIT